MAGDNQYVQVLPNNASVYVDLDPTYSDTVTAAYLSVLMFVDSAAQLDIAANAGSVINYISTDGFALGIHSTGGNFFWDTSLGTGVDFAPVAFDTFSQIEIHAVAGSTAYDIKIDGVLYAGIQSPFLPATGVNFWSVNGMPPTFVGDGGGSTVDDTFGFDELSWQTTNWVSSAGAFARWAFDGTDPIGDAPINYPDPPWVADDAGDPANLVIATGGGTNADLAPGEDTGGGSGQGPQGCVTTVTLDGTDVTGVALTGSVTRRLNRPAQATIKIPMDAAIGGPGSRLAVYFGGSLFFHGFVLDCETDGGEDDGYTVYNATDPMELWNWRVVRDDDGDFSLPAIIDTYVTGPQIMEAVLKNTEGDTTAQGNPALTPPTTTEGPTFLTFGSFAAGGVDLTGAPTDWPMTIAQLSSLLMSSGELDLVITPTDPGAGIMGTIDAFNGNYGQDLSGSVTFSYGTGALNVRAMRWNEDMSTMVNKLWYYLGPRVGTSSDPAGDQHWRANVTGDDTGLAYPPGGKLSPPYTSLNNQLGVLRVDSQTTLGPSGTGYGVRMQVQIFDAQGDADPSSARELYRRLWQIESWLRAVPRNLVHVTPTRGAGFPLFDIGDLIGVEAGAQIRGGFSGAQRVYGYTISWTEDGPCELSEIQTSSDQEGF